MELIIILCILIEIKYSIIIIRNSKRHFGLFSVLFNKNEVHLMNIMYTDESVSMCVR
jgi:hypothetical protein